KNDASIAKNLVQGTSEKLSTSIATSAEGAIKQKVVKGGFDPIFRLLPDKILFGLFAKQIQGGALRYHLKKALSRSLNYDDFKIKLEKELKRTNFNSNTSRLIDEFMQNLDTFNAEKEAKLAKIREEQARIKEEERKRAEAIKTAQENAYNAQEANLGNDILEPSSLKEDFGENFAGYKGKEAIEKLLEEQRGQVKGAFYKEGLGEIDLVWGDENFGLRHIIEQRTKQWGEEKALKFISHLNENIEKGQIVEVQKGRAAIKTDLTTIILDKKENNNFVLTAFRDRNNKKELESLNLSQSKTFTSENAEANAKESPVTSLNQENIIAQNAKNDEVLEAEVIEEVGLNEPMKFLEFQQRKLLTYIKENTPLRLLEHKKELKTRDILNFLEQSALNGKQKVFLMRNLERDLEKLEAQLKEAEEVGFKEAKNAVDDDFLKGYDEKIKQNIKSLEFENELIENPRPRGREPQDRYISLAYFMANFAQHYKLLDLKNPRTKEQIKLLENALKKQNIGYEVLENEPVAIRYFKKEWVKRQGAKQKTINKVDEYAKSEEFKALSEDKQEAILSLKNLEPSIMPSEISKDNLENILKHFNSKQDKARREFYAKLFNDTKENPHIVLEVKRENELRQEYIKAYQHKDTHDLYYIAITKDKDTINVTGYPITKIKDVINQIKNAEKVVWRQQGDQTHTALVSKETQNLESVNESITQNSQEAKIKEAVKNHNAIYKEILDNDYIFTDERSKIFRKRERELIENLAKDEKVQAFTSQWGYPFKKDGELHGIGLDYKAKVYGKGKHKMMRVSGGGFGSATQQKKEKRLLELEKERLQEAFKADFGIDGFISKSVENGFFETLWRETSAYKGTDYGWGVHPREYYPYYENRIMPSDTITQAKEKLQKEKSSWSVKRQEAKGSEDIIFTDKKGKEHTLTKETQKAWLEAFGLKSLDEEFIPNLPRELKEALGKEIKLTKGSLYKIVEKGREKYIPQMKQTLQNPDFALRDRDNMLILAKQIEDKQYFTSVNLETKDYFISVSNAPKKENILKNKVENGAEILYQSPNAKSIFYTDTLLQTDKSSANKIDEDIIAQNAKKAEFESFKDKIKELYTKYEGLNPYDKSASQLRIKLLDEEIKPEIKKEFKNIIDKFKGADNKDKILRVIKENKEELSDYLAFHIALRKDIYIDGYGEGRYDFYDKSIRGLFKFRENKPGSEIYDDSNYRTLAALENLSNKNTSLYFSFRDLNGKVGEFKTYPRIQDLLFYDLPLGYDLKNAVILSTKDKHLKEKLIEKLKAYIDKKIYADFLEYKIKDLESRNPKNSYFENYKDEKWDEEALKGFKKELEDLRANEKAQKLETKGSEDIIFTDKKGKEHTLTKETQKAWLEAFGLKSLEEAYIPNFKAEVKEAINRVLGGEEIKLTKGSFEKLLKEKRLKYLDRIKPTLENPHSVILQNDGALIFARDYGEEKYFTSVARNDSGEWIIRSNAPKSKNGLNNKILNGGKEIYNDQAASQINASNPYDDIANSNIKLDNESIAQNSHYLELVKEYGEENAKRIIKQKILSENIAQVLENEEEKFIYKKGDREFEFKIKDAMGQFEMQYDELNLKSDLNKSFLKALNKLKIGYEVLENEPVRIRYFKQEAKERKPKETKPSANKTLGQIQKDMSARLKELKAQAKENYERYKNEDKALQKELTNTKDLFKAFEKEFNETEGTILISRAKRRKNDAEGKVETSVFLGNELALRNALDRWERYSGYSEENALEVKERLELLRSYVKRLEKHREDIKAKREQLEQDYQQNEAARSKEMGVIGNYNILSNLKGVSENELYEPFLEKVGGYLSKADFYERHLPFAREEFQKLFNITPLKEFGTNYAEFYRDGKGAVEKLLKEAEDFKQRGEKGEFKGQVAGAFYKEGLGEIDLVWGDENFGLRHIIDKHGDEFEDIAAELDEIIAKGVLEKGEHRYFIKHNDYKGMIALDYKGKESNAWILTLYKDKSALNPAYQHQIKHNTNTSSETRANGEFENSNIKNANLQKEKVDKLFHGDAEVISAQGKFNELEALNLTDEDIIPQQKIKFAMEKFHYDEKKAKDLLEWHKNSHALTKDENGLPKVFYHGTYSKFRVFRRVGKASGQGFFFTPSQKATEEYGDITLNTFLNIKNPFRADELKINKEADLQKWADILKLDYDKEKYESFKDLKTKLEKVKEATKKAGFKFHSASGGSVYVIDNKGRNRFINLEELDKENKRVVEAFKGLETEDIYFYYVVRNEFDLVLYALNKNDRYFHTSGRDEVKRVLEKLGYDGVVLNDTIITVFNSNQIKHIDNKGSFTDTKGNVTSKKPKNKEAEFSYFNEKSDNIYHSNPHLGAGLVGGVLNGVEQDENGNLSFDPVKFAMGFLGGAAGSKAVKESIKWRANKVKKAYPNIAKNNPALMEQIAKRDLLTYAKNETQNALTRLLNKNKLFDSTKGLFAGEKALLNEAYAPHKARLEKAKELEGSGADEIEIWEKTGWYKDKDHKWKFEISQRGGELDLAKIKDKDSEAKLGEILKDDELFKAYPQLRDMSVKHVDLSGNYGFYYVPYNDIKLVRPHIQLDIDEIKTSPYKVKEVLYHEIQHAIQHKEQFAYGLSYMAETYERYLKQHGEVEARNIQERMKNPTKIHPHKTMDTDIEDTIAESALSTEYSEAFSRKLEKSFLDESGRIAYKSLMQNAEKL
ncbi:PBECR2 nuclease fold domain-containing protein, partial [Campylobacter upsaliensis]